MTNVTLLIFDRFSFSLEICISVNMKLFVIFFSVYFVEIFVMNIKEMNVILFTKVMNVLEY